MRAALVALIYFALAATTDSLFLKILLFAAIAVMLALLGFFRSPGADSGMERLAVSIEKMADGKLEILKASDLEDSTRGSAFSVAILFLNARLRQMVDKVKGLAGSVGATSERIVELSRALLKLELTQSEAAEKSMRAMQEINVAITRIARGVESLNQLGLTASSASLELTASIEEVTGNAFQVGEFAKDTQAAMGRMVKGFREVANAGEMLGQAVVDTDSSMQAMKRRSLEVTELARESDELSDLAADTARSGRRVVTEVEHEMTKIAETFQSASGVVGNLSRRSEQIGEILNVITQIADQTNLLSLNAAILSAQAGVHGKGFAVVADEIRKLSSRTAASVGEIDQLVHQVRQEIREAVDFMEEGKRRLAEGLEKSGHASEALGAILNSTTRARERVSEIRTASIAQTDAEREVDRTTTVIKERIHQITGVIQEQTKVSREVYTRAERTIDLLQSVEKGMQEQTGGAKEVSRTVDRVSEIIQNIHTATSTQSITSAQIVQAVERLKAALEAGTTTIRALNSTALALDQESFILKHELGRFQLPEPKKGGTISYGITASISSLDPAYAQYVHLAEITGNFYEGMVESGEGSDVRPCLAEKWEISPDGLIYTFKIKKNARFHNGKDVTAADVAASFERVVHPQTKSPGAWVFDMVEGADDFREGRTRNITGLTVLDTKTLAVRLREPVPFFLSMLGQAYAYVIPSEQSAQRGALNEVIGTGAFKLDRFIPEREIEMSRFDDYHTPPHPYVDRVQIRLSMTEAELAEGMRSGKLHFTAELTKQNLRHFLEEPQWRPRFQTNVQLYTQLLALNLKTAPLNDVRVRRAISFAIDREKICRDIIGAEQSIVANTLLPPGLPGHDPMAPASVFDPSRARDLLRQAGLREGTVIEALYPESQAFRPVLLFIQQNLKDVGLDLQIRFLSSESFQRAVDKGLCGVRLTRWVADYPDPDNFLYVTFHSKNPVFQIGFENKEFDRLTEQARCLADVQERIRLYQRAERIWLEECPCVVLFHMRALVLHQDSVQGCIPHFTQPVLRLKKMWLS